ncbi:MAG: DUF6350 family protein [Propionibacteriaceae bacterium]|jgi:hypothetical protein|nr:DUF6350 family protein [Propionibacteriaceae bacterium]
MTLLIDAAHRRPILRTPSSTPPPIQTGTPLPSWRQLLLVALGPSVIGLAAAAGLVFAALASAGSGREALAQAVAAIWLVAHHSPLSVEGVPMDVTPLGVTLVLLWLVWAANRWMATKIAAASPDRRVDGKASGLLAGASVLGAATATAAALAVIVGTGVEATPGTALIWTCVLHGFAAALGAQPPAQRSEIAWHGIRAGVAVVAALTALAAIGLFAAAITRWFAVGELLSGGDIASAAGLSVISLAYLPNVVVAATGVLAGASVGFGDVWLSVWGSLPGQMPPIPLLAAIATPNSALLPLLLVFPLALGVLAGHTACREGSGQAALVAVVRAAAGIGIVYWAAAELAGGTMAGFGDVDLTPWACGLLIFGWLAGPGAVTVVLTTWWRGRAGEELAANESKAIKPAAEPEPKPEPEPEPEPEPAELSAGDTEPAETGAVEPDLAEAEEAAPDLAAVAEEAGLKPRGRHRRTASRRPRGAIPAAGGDGPGA